MSFESLSTLKNVLSAASLPTELLQQDLLTPVLVSVQQLQTLGLAVPE